MDAEKWDVVADRNPRISAGPHIGPVGGGQAAPLPVIQVRLNGMGTAIGHLEDLIPGLEERIYTALRASSPTTVSAEQRPPLEVPLAEDLARFTERIATVVERLGDIIMRVEL